MAIGVLAGLLANILFELLWWLGPVVALPISAVGPGQAFRDAKAAAATAAAR